MLVGLPEQAVKESIHRIERALVNSGFVLPANRVVINLAPADLPKQAVSFDLPIALGLLAASGQIAPELLDQYAIVGEVALDGTMRPVKGALSMAMTARSHPASGRLRGLIVPATNADEAAVVEGIDVIPVNSLTEAAAFLVEQLAIEPAPCRNAELFDELGQYEEDFGEVRGQEMAKRAVMIAAAGNHHLLIAVATRRRGIGLLHENSRQVLYQHAPRRARLNNRLRFSPARWAGPEFGHAAPRIFTKFLLKLSHHL